MRKADPMSEETIRTNIVLDKALVEEALRETGLETRRELVDHALRELARHRHQRKLLELKGAVRWEGNLVDTSVWIDLFRGVDAAHVAHPEALVRADDDVAICGINLTEVLQGIPDEPTHRRVARRLADLVLLPLDERTLLDAADIYRTLRAKGVTIRKTNDCIIAACAMQHECALLHNDRDFVQIARHLPLVTVD